MQNSSDQSGRPSDANAVLAITLRQIDGLGAVGVTKLLRSYDSLEELQECPLEQVLVRLRGIPGAATLAARILDASLIAELRRAAERELLELQEKRIEVVTAAHPMVSDRMQRLQGRYSSPILFLYGDTEVLGSSTAATFVVDGGSLSADSFEHLQRLARTVMTSGHPIMTGTRPGADVVLSKIAIASAGQGGPSSVGVCDSGLARIDPTFRSTATQIVRSGGALVSPFDMVHGPFDHDLAHRDALMAALGTVVVYCASSERPASENTHFQMLADFCRDRHIPLFILGDKTPDRPDVHPLVGATDDEWVLAALSSSRKRQ